ncbi:MAG: hypothetical protein C4297_13745 [Gemmataceae bacterium]
MHRHERLEAGARADRRLTGPTRGRTGASSRQLIAVAIDAPMQTRLVSFVRRHMEQLPEATS